VVTIRTSDSGIKIFCIIHTKVVYFFPVTFTVNKILQVKSISRLVFLMDTHCVDLLCEVRPELYIYIYNSNACYSRKIEEYCTRNWKIKVFYLF